MSVNTVNSTWQHILYCDVYQFSEKASQEIITQFDSAVDSSVVTCTYNRQSMSFEISCLACNASSALSTLKQLSRKFIKCEEITHEQVPQHSKVRQAQCILEAIEDEATIPKTALEDVAEDPDADVVKDADILLSRVQEPWTPSYAITDLKQLASQSLDEIAALTNAELFLDHVYQHVTIKAETYSNYELARQKLTVVERQINRAPAIKHIVRLDDKFKENDDSLQFTKLRQLNDGTLGRIILPVPSTQVDGLLNASILRDYRFDSGIDNWFSPKRRIKAPVRQATVARDWKFRYDNFGHEQTRLLITSLADQIENPVEQWVAAVVDASIPTVQSETRADLLIDLSTPDEHSMVSKDSSTSLNRSWPAPSLATTHSSSKQNRPIENENYAQSDVSKKSLRLSGIGNNLADDPAATTPSLLIRTYEETPKETVDWATTAYEGTWSATKAPVMTGRENVVPILWNPSLQISSDETIKGPSLTMPQAKVAKIERFDDPQPAASWAQIAATPHRTEPSFHSPSTGRGRGKVKDNYVSKPTLSNLNAKHASRKAMQKGGSKAVGNAINPYDALANLSNDGSSKESIVSHEPSAEEAATSVDDLYTAQVSEDQGISLEKIDSDDEKDQRVYRRTMKHRIAEASYSCAKSSSEPTFQTANFQLEAQTQIDAKHSRMLEKLKLCNSYYLKNDCKFGRSCKFAHDVEISSADLQFLRTSLARRLRDKDEKCDDPHCVDQHKHLRASNGKHRVRNRTLQNRASAPQSSSSNVKKRSMPKKGRPVNMVGSSLIETALSYVESPLQLSGKIQHPTAHAQISPSARSDMFDDEIVVRRFSGTLQRPQRIQYSISNLLASANRNMTTATPASSRCAPSEELCETLTEPAVSVSDADDKGNIGIRQCSPNLRRGLYTALENARAFRGHVEVETQIGQVFLGAAEIKSHSILAKPLRLSDLGPNLKEVKSFADHGSHFTTAVTSTPADVDHILDAVGSTASEISSESYLELICLLPDQAEICIHVDVMKPASPGLSRSAPCLITHQSLIGAVYMHFPQETYDARIIVQGTKHDDISKYPECQSVVNRLSVQTPPGMSLPRVEGYDGHGVQVQHIKLHCAIRERTSDDAIYVKSKRVYNFIVYRHTDQNTEDRGLFIAEFLPDGLQWFEVSLGLMKCSANLNEGEGMELGDEVGWKAEDVIDEASIGSLERLTNKLVRGMNKIGSANQGQAWRKERAMFKKKEENLGKSDQFW